MTRQSRWCPCPRNPRYEISDRGEIRNAATKKRLRPTPNENGYLQVKLYEGDMTRKWYKIHLLVLETFVGPRPSPRHHGAHAPDRDRSNCRLRNLRWATPEENERDKAAHGTKRGGGRHCRPNKARIERIKQRVARGESYTKVSKDEGVHRHTISRIIRGLRRAA